MELLDRYLKTARPFLPKEQQDDILKELSENIQTQMDDREAELGHPLQEAEQEAILRQIGHPVLVAGRYRSDQRSVTFGRRLIGPELFPFYWKVLRINVGITAVILLLITIARFATDASFTVPEAFSTFLFALSLQFGIVTLIFTAADASLTKFPDLRRPERRSAYRFLTDAVAQPTMNTNRVPRLESFSQLVALAVFTPWFLSVLRSPESLFGAAAHLQLSPVWSQVYYPVLFLALASMAQAGINLARPGWVQFRLIVRVGANVVGMGLVYMMLSVGTWVAGADPSGNLAGDSMRKVEIVNQCIFYSLLMAGIIAALLIVFDIRRLIRFQRGRTP